MAQIISVSRHPPTDLRTIIPGVTHSSCRHHVVDESIGRPAAAAAVGSPLGVSTGKQETGNESILRAVGDRDPLLRVASCPRQGGAAAHLGLS